MKKLILAAMISLSPLQAHAGATIQVKVHGLVCDFCSQAIGMIMSRDPSVAATQVNLTSKIVTIRLRNGRNITNQRVNQLITSAGYKVVGISR